MNSDQQFLFETAIINLIDYVVRYENMPLMDAFNVVYASKLHRLLENTQTHLYSEGPVYLYDMLCEERGMRNPVC